MRRVEYNTPEARPWLCSSATTGSSSVSATRLNELGARRIWRGNAWYWDLKPDLKPGEVFDL